MDPITAVAFAASILTFVDYSMEVFANAKRLYELNTRATEENDELESLTRDLKTRVEDWRKAFETRNGSDAELDYLSKQCIHLADELLAVLHSVKTKGDAHFGQSIVKAIKTMRKQNPINTLRNRLDRIRKQLIDFLTVDKLDRITEQLRDMAIENRTLQANRSHVIDQLRLDFSSAIEQFNDRGEQTTPEAWLFLSDATCRGQTYLAEQVILQNLKFSAFDSREHSITKSHSDTFSWIFDQPSSTKFVEWLKGRDTVYWVSGKPGSGKSTLMKFIASHEWTRGFLETWAADKRLVVANFYFWGASAQRSLTSQSGLLRTILHQILRQCPDLIQTAYHDQWTAMTSGGRILNECLDELSTTRALLDKLRALSTWTATNTKFCFFIDGLDEYGGRPADIIELIDILKSFENVKTCVSSRPWNEFEDRFGNDSSRMLYMHEHTEGDIRDYVKDSLGQSPQYRRLQHEDPKCPDFIAQIVNRADGVFLWVLLVVRSLVDGLTNSDRITDLQHRLVETPKDLEDYFQQILFSTENRYRRQTARMLVTAINADTELPLMAYWVIDQEDPGFVFRRKAVLPAVETSASRLETMRRRLRVLSKGLLEPDPPGPRGPFDLVLGERVGFLHRTVGDYLQTPYAQSMLRTWLDHTLNVDSEIASSLGTLAKLAPLGFFFHVENAWSDSSMGFPGPARRLDRNPTLRPDLTSMLNQLETAVTSAVMEHNGEPLADLRRHYLVPGHVIVQTVEPDLVVISACIYYQLTNYVAEKFTNQPELGVRVTKYIPSLYLAVKTVSEYVGHGVWGTGFDSYAISMLELLLAHGADPNREFLNGKSFRHSEWEMILAFSQGHQPSGRFEAVKILLEHGADFEQECTPLWTGIPGEKRKVKAKEILGRVFDADQFTVFEDIVQARMRKVEDGHGMTKKKHRLKFLSRFGKN